MIYSIIEIIAFVILLFGVLIHIITLIWAVIFYKSNLIAVNKSIKKHKDKKAKEKKEEAIPENTKSVQSELFLEEVASEHNTERLPDYSSEAGNTALLDDDSNDVMLEIDYSEIVVFGKEN